jgi:hypothetical protein
MQERLLMEKHRTGTRVGSKPRPSTPYEIEVYTEGSNTSHDICTAQANSTGASTEMIVNTDGLASIAHARITVKTFRGKTFLSLQQENLYML